MVNVDVSATAFYEGGLLPQMVVKILNWRSLDDLRRGISDRDRVKLEKVLRSLKIKVIPPAYRRWRSALFRRMAQCVS